MSVEPMLGASLQASRLVCANTNGSAVRHIPHPANSHHVRSMACFHHLQSILDSPMPGQFGHQFPVSRRRPHGGGYNQRQSRGIGIRRCNGAGGRAAMGSFPRRYDDRPTDRPKCVYLFTSSKQCLRRSPTGTVGGGRSHAQMKCRRRGAREQP